MEFLKSVLLSKVPQKLKKVQTKTQKYQIKTKINNGLKIYTKWTETVT